MIAMYRAFYCEFNIMAIIIVAMLMIASVAGWGQSTKEQIFRGALGCLNAFLVFDMLWILLDETAFLAAHPWTMYAVKSAYFLSADLNAFYLYLYFRQGDRNKDMKAIRTRILHTIPPLLIHVALLIVNIPTGILLYLNDNNEYTRGSAFIIQYILIFSYLICSTVYLLQLAGKKEMRTDRKHILIDAAFPLIPLIGGTLQYFNPHIPINNTAFTVGVLYLFLSYAQQQVSVEPLTGLSNRRYIIKYLEQLSEETKSGMSNYLFMADINDFKAINDTFGHPEGDRALQFVSTGITNACNLLDCRYKAARYGGDEFLFVVEAPDDFDVKPFIDSIQENITRVSTNHRFPGTITISIGHVVMGDDIGASIKAADDCLYYYKRKYHKQHD